MPECFEGGVDGAGEFASDEDPENSQATRMVGGFGPFSLAATCAAVVSSPGGLAWSGCPEELAPHPGDGLGGAG